MTKNTVLEFDAYLRNVFLDMGSDKRRGGGKEWELRGLPPHIRSAGEGEMRKAARRADWACTASQEFILYENTHVSSTAPKETELQKTLQQLTAFKEQLIEVSVKFLVFVIFVHAVGSVIRLWKLRCILRNVMNLTPRSWATVTFQSVFLWSRVLNWKHYDEL